MSSKKIIKRVEGERLVLAPPQRDHLTPEQRLREHLDSKKQPAEAGSTVRTRLRAELGYDSAAKVIRRSFDRTVKPKKRKGKK